MMKKQIPAWIAAFAVTGCVAAAMLVFGVNAFFNKNSQTVSNSPTSGAALVSASLSSEQAQIAQLQNRINEYQQRETQYQQLLERDQNQLQLTQNQLDQAAQQIQQFQNFLVALQSRGLIQVRGDGSVLITARPVQ